MMNGSDQLAGQHRSQWAGHQRRDDRGQKAEPVFIRHRRPWPEYFGAISIGTTDFGGPMMISIKKKPGGKKT